MSLATTVLGEIAEMVKALRELFEVAKPEAVAVVVVGSAILGYLLAMLIRLLRRPGKTSPPPEPITIIDPNPGLKEELERYRKVLSELSKDDAELWRLHPPQPPSHLAERLKASKTKVVLVGHLKGGVGKTTLLSNLAAYFENTRTAEEGKILAIDFDYQGSLTATLLRAAGKDIEGPFSDRLLTGRTSAAELLATAEDLHPLLSNTRLIPAAYTLAQKENQLMIRWALGEPVGDIRFHFADFVLSPEVQKAYHLVLVDMGPRLTTASIAALGACTHLVVPTILDQLSAEAVGSFLRQVKILTDDMRSGLDNVSIVGTMTRQQELHGANQVALQTILAAVKEWGGGARLIDRNIPFKQAFIECAGTDIAYQSRQLDAQTRREVKDTFDAIGSALRKRVFT